jgi:hypothetical protein
MKQPSRQSEVRIVVWVSLSAGTATTGGWNDPNPVRADLSLLNLPITFLLEKRAGPTDFLVASAQ